MLRHRMRCGWDPVEVGGMPPSSRGGITQSASEVASWIFSLLTSKRARGGNYKRAIELQERIAREGTGI